MVESLAGILLLALVLALLLAYSRGGTAAVGEWLHAKYVGSGQ
jgi:hypothetical protein